MFSLCVNSKRGSVFPARHPLCDLACGKGTTAIPYCNKGDKLTQDGRTVGLGRMSDRVFRNNDWSMVGWQGTPVIQMTRLEAPKTEDPKPRVSAVEAPRVKYLKLYFHSVPRPRRANVSVPSAQTSCVWLRATEAPGEGAARASSGTILRARPTAMVV